VSSTICLYERPAHRRKRAGWLLVRASASIALFLVARCDSHVGAVLGAGSA
jgi:hypothetical protein